MSDIATPYRHHELYTPVVAPFDTAGTLLWPTLVGTFLRPIIESFPNMPYWFCNHGTDFQFCFAYKDYKKVEEVIEAQKKTYQTTTKIQPVEGATVGTAFRGERWLAKNKMDDGVLASKRAQLVFGFLHSTSALYFDGLVQDGVHWKAEKNDDEQNPEGSGFESLLHLLSNITQVPTPIYEFELGSHRGLQTLFVISHLAHEVGLEPKLHKNILVQF